MDLEDLLKLIIPGIFMVMWALNQVLGREAAPNAQGQPRVPRRGSLPPAPRPPRPIPPPAREVPPPWQVAPSSVASGGGRGSNRPESALDEVLVIGGDPRMGGSAGQVGGRRGGRGRSKTGRGTEPTPSPRSRAPVESNSSNSMFSGLAASPVSTMDPSAVIGSASLPAPPMVHPLVRGLVESRERVRDAFMLQEILGPPRSLRHRPKS